MPVAQTFDQVLADLMRVDAPNRAQVSPAKLHIGIAMLSMRGSRVIHSTKHVLSSYWLPEPKTEKQDHRTLEQRIADELGLTPNLCMQTLKKIRRSFARSYHPDRDDVCNRDLANQRMAIANRLIDEAINKRLTLGLWAADLCTKRQRHQPPKLMS